MSKHLAFFLTLASCCYLAPLSFAAPQEVPGALSTQETAIARASDSEKIPLIIDFLYKNVHFMQDKSLAYCRQALAILAKHPNPDYESQIMSYQATANMYLGKTTLATEQITRALALADSQNNDANRILAYKVMGRIQASLFQHQAALATLEKSYDIAVKTDDNRNQAGLLRLMAYEYRNLSLLGKSLEFHLQSKKLYQALGDNKQSAHQLANAGSLYRSIGDLDTALDYLLQALKVMQDLGDAQALAILYNNTARVYQSLGDYNQALVMYQESLTIKEELGYRRGIVLTLLNMGESYRLAGENTEALNKLEKALALAREIKHTVREGVAALHLGKLYREQQDFPHAEGYLTTALDIFTRAENPSRIADVKLAMGKMRTMQGEHRVAIEMLKQSIKIADKASANATVLAAYRELSLNYEQIGEFQLALAANKNYQGLQKEISGQKSQQRIDVLRVSYNLDQKQRQIESLTQKNKISALEITNQIAKRNTYLIALFFSFSLLAFVYYRINTRRQLATERKALQEITVSKERLKLALWGGGNELWDWDLGSHQVTRINHFSDISLPEAYPDNDIAPLKGSVHPDDYPLLALSLEQYLTSHLGFFEACYRLKRKDGSWMWVLDRGKAVEFDLQGNPTRITGTLRDISDLKSHEQALIKLNAELELRVEKRTAALKVANRELQDKIEELKDLQLTLVEVEKIASLARLVSGIAHEINTPLGITITAVSALKELTEAFIGSFHAQKLTRSEMENFISRLQTSCELIENNAARSSALIQTFKQVSVDQSSENAKNFDLQGCIEQAFTGFKSQLAQGEHSYSIACPRSITIFSYPESLIQVMAILIENSLFHGFEKTKGGVIRITLSKNQDRVYIEYQDNGQGIKQEDIDQLFEPFYTTKRNKNFTGLGLHIAYNQVSHRLGGSIFYQMPPPETGAAFTICIPADISRKV
ncbi:tetratricopeptide repeat protein [Thalassomonas viridans]|uniref:histidine kinase n=1 Tax=Thalassomonas viridans TaxID=137584 RepID=A0AAF0C7N9_9GAMM|nr:tetratricopeptide repeat protein [Thalassomonas viridans]WDE03541.1 tetratricopeptide repeat protein [Thalassomonas viridans]